MDSVPKEYKKGVKKVLKFFSAKDEEQCKRNLYKYTDCGAWIEFADWGITLGSIVEGCDSDVPTHKLKYGKGFTEKAIQKAINSIEKDADLIWNWANKIREGGKTDAEMGIDWPLL